ncbi:MAG TPA: hypothetical protein DD734_02465 [Firmicutes bacterium]|nr:hypothetical protein [Bacillota bacterium]
MNNSNYSAFGACRVSTFRIRSIPSKTLSQAFAFFLVGFGLRKVRLLASIFILSGVQAVARVNDYQKKKHTLKVCFAFFPFLV